MKKLTPEQARWLKERAGELWQEVADRDECDHRTGVESYRGAIDELTAKPGDEEFCEGCKHWATGNGRDFSCVYEAHKASKEGGSDATFWILLKQAFEASPPGVCPIGRWEEK